MADPSFAGAQQALFDQLRSTFPSVSSNTVQSIVQQHSFDPRKCFDLVRLEAALPTSTSQSNFVDSRDRFCPAGSVVRPIGSYIIRRSTDSPSPQVGLCRDTRSDTPPRYSPQPQSLQFSTITRPEALQLRQRSLSPMTPAGLDDVVHSYPGTPTGGVQQGPNRSFSYVGNIPALQINYSVPSQITFNSSPGSPTLILSSQPSLRPYSQYARRPSQSPTGIVNPSLWQYDRRPSFADVELAQNSSREQSTPSSISSHHGSLRMSVDNLTETTRPSFGSIQRPTTPLVSPPIDVASLRFRTPNSPNIRIQLDTLTGGAVISNVDPGLTIGARPRPKVTFIQQRHPTSATGLSLSLRQHIPQLLQTYDGTALMNSMVSKQTQAEECLKSWLSHQSSRLIDMRKAMTLDKSRLEELRADVSSLEQDLAKSRKNTIRSETISDEALSSLHKETRELQAKVQTMLRELDCIRMQAALKPNCKEENVIDVEHWSCSFCTFQNYFEMPVCELCEMPRVTDVDGWQLVSDVSPSASFESTKAWS